MDKIDMLIVGGGGREHALAWLVGQSGHVHRIYVAPGNSGIAELEDCECILISPRDPAALVAFAKSKPVDLVVIGPEDPICSDGLSDRLRRAGIPVFAPSQKAARIESSKAWALRQMRDANVPTVDWFRSFMSFDAAARFIHRWGGPMVVKADGLAAGKGVSVCETVEGALQATSAMLVDGLHKEAGRRVVLTQDLGRHQEVSYQVIAAARQFISLPPCEDNKRLKTGGQGPNTGGMGSHVPTTALTYEEEEFVKQGIVQPLLNHLADIGCPYYGCLYVGLMLMTPSYPRVVEINCRFGDTEMETLAMVLNPDDFVQALWNAANGCLDKDQKIGTGLYSAAACVVKASEGYPEKPIIGRPITGIKAVEKFRGVKVFHSGTMRLGRRLVTAGGRVVVVTAGGANVSEAVTRAYAAAKCVKFQGAQQRADIGWREITRESRK